MKYVVVGLGNPGGEYEETRHNVGRMVATGLAERIEASDWRSDKKLHAQIAQGVVNREEKVVIVLPDNYMNRSGGSVAPLVTSKKQAERLIVIHDDIDLPLGGLRVAFNRGAGGHNGVLSIEKAIKTRSYIRVRVGVIPTTPTGKLRKPKDKDGVHSFILKRLNKKDLAALQDEVELAIDAVYKIITEGYQAAMRDCNRTR